MRAILGGVLVLALAGQVALLAGQAKPDPAKLIGRWEPVTEKAEKKKDKKDEPAATPTGPPPPPTTIEFTKDGKVHLIVGEPGRDYRLSGTYRLTDSKLAVSFKMADREIAETLTVKKLTDAELVTEDSKNRVETLRRKP